MITEPTSPTRHRQPTVERRRNQRLRGRFDTAMALIRPMLDCPHCDDTKMYLVMQRLHNTYPDLSAGEVEILVMSVVRALRKNKALRLVVSR